MKLTKFDCIKRVLVTQKSKMLLKQRSQVVLEVHPRANKPMIKQAAQELLGDVKVKKVAVINVPGRSKRLKRGISVVVGAHKKAIVTVVGLTEQAVAMAANNRAN